MTNIIKRKIDWLSNYLRLWHYYRKNLLLRLDQEPVSTKCLKGVGEDSHSQACNHWSNSAVLAPYVPPHSLMLQYMQVNSTSWAYHVITLMTAPTLPSPRRLAGARHKSSLLMRCHTRFARPDALCDADRAS